MTSLAPLDKALIGILFPLWAICFGLAVRSQTRGDVRPAIGVSAPTDGSGYLTATGRVYPLARASFAESGLVAGDRLVRLGEFDLRGMGRLEFAALSSELGAGGRRVALVVERGSRRERTFLPMAPLTAYLGGLLLSLSFVVTSLALLFRAPRSPPLRAWLHTALPFAFMSLYFGGSREAFYAWALAVVAGSTLAFPAMIRFTRIFPHGNPPHGWWARIWPVFFAVHGFFNLLMVLGAVDIGARGAVATISAGSVCSVALMTRNYRSGDLVQRRQIKWVLFGTYCAALPAGAAGILSAVDPRFFWLALAAWAAAALIPLFLAVSVARFNLFDIDRLVSATASYNVLLVLVVGAAFVLVPRAAEAMAAGLEIDPEAGQAAFLLVLAALIVPAQRRLRPQVERLFFKERYAADRGIAELLPTLSHCPDPRSLTAQVGEALHRLLRPELCVLYAVVGESYVPVFVEGRVVPPAFDAAGPLVGTLRARRAPLALGRAGRRPDQTPLSPVDRASLETLGAEVVVSIRQQEDLPAFLCLGPKRSGDVYTSTDLSLLAAVAETVARQLQVFHQDALIRESREMQEALRRYVPGAVADQISRGGEPTPGERDVSVLFVDIRGYTSFSESRRAEEIFSTVNRYTETVSGIVRKRGGAVVEFNGDGMMAVFGAPEEVAHKERAAVEAGIEIVDAVGALPLERSKGVGTRLAVGVGIATGRDFVGNIRAVDRLIWTAIGNTTNLAARLQSLTRELDAALVIDSSTWEGARPAAADFEKRSRVPIRGRRETQDVFVLPLRPDPY
ncbi:MAG: adenylate/guanylate cyclase domain-containing protein [Myxococcota bacterium]|nr:adenylate/guanylate cyclase domain-containing protein [Myxococcota bacterium]